MSEICPHCRKGFKRLASHEWRCKEKGTAAPPSSTLQPRSSGTSGTPKGAGRSTTPTASKSSGAWRSTTPTASKSSGARRPTSASVGNSPADGRSSASARKDSSPKPAEVVVNICPDCGANYRYKHEVCHSRGSGKREDKAAYDVMEVCPDCGRSYKYKHTVCRGRQSSNPVRHHRLVIPNRPRNQQSTHHEYTSGHDHRTHENRGTRDYKGDLAESEGLAAAFEASVHVQKSGQRKPHRQRHGRDCNGGLNEEALVAAFKAGLNLKEERP